MKLNKEQIKRIARKKQRKHVISHIQRIKKSMRLDAKLGNRVAIIYNEYPHLLTGSEARNNIDIAIRFLEIKYQLRTERIDDRLSLRYLIYLY